MSMPACPLPLDCDTVTGTLVINGWSLHTGAWCAWDLSPLLESPAVKGENVPGPEHLPGNRARAVLDAETDYSLPMVFSGAVDRTGAAYADPWGGLEDNRAAAMARWVTPIRAGTASLAATLTRPTGSGGTKVLSADVQPVRLSWAERPGGYANAVLVVRVPLGGFV